MAESTGDVATLDFVFITDGEEGELLMFALPHHQEVLGNELINELRINSLKGDMVAVSGDVWLMTEQLTTITWNSPRPIAEDKLADIEAALQEDINKAVVNTDTYFGGKQLAAIARLSLIADEVGQADLAETYRTNLKGFIARWLEINGELVYDQSWGGVNDKIGINDPQGNFGFGFYNDHYFHLGYFIYAAAVLAKSDPAWLEANQDAVMSMLRDISNPAVMRADPNFTFMRNKDWFVGHSWAAGIFSDPDGRNQESTSEAVNAWYAVSLFGLATGNDRIRDLGRLALATELRTTFYYWQMKSDDVIYPSNFAENKVVGRVWGSKVDYNTWFGPNVEFIHCIQMLPFTPITEELLPADWIMEEYPVVAEALPTAGEGWKGFIYMAHAIIDKETAWNEAQTLTSYDDGNSKTNTLYWLATRP